MMGKIVLTLGDESRSRSFDITLQPFEERLPPKTRRDGIQNLHQDGPGVAVHRPPRPKQAGIESDWDACNAQLRIEPRYAILVSGLGSRRPAGAFRKKDDRAVARQLSARAGGHLRPRPGGPAPTQSEHARPPRSPARR